ncbi:MAG: hypothetical protein RIB98_12285 [Acidimicrobiales bacterium]
MNDSPDRRSSNLSDDDLGAALGNSVRGRVDDVPTITPGFDGVERRARQITNRRRALAGVAVGAFLLLGGFGLASLTDDDDGIDQDTVDQPDDGTVPDDSTPPDDHSVPDDGEDAGFAGSTTGLIDGREFVRVNADGSVDDDMTTTVLYTATPGEFITEALALADGSFLLEVGATPDDLAGVVRHHRTDDTVAVLSEFGDLVGGAVVDGVPLAFVGDIPTFADGGLTEDLTGDLRKFDLTTGDSDVFLADAYGIEWSVDRVDVHGGLVLVSSGSEGGPSWTVHDLDGVDLGFPDPLDREEILPAGDTQVYAARFDADGDGVWYLQQDFGGGWTLEGVNFNGTEPRSLDLGIDADAGLRLTLEVDPQLLVVNISPATDEGMTTIWVDPAELTAEGVSLEQEDGYVNFVQTAQDSSGTPPPEPTVVTPTAPTTTTEPILWPADLNGATPPALVLADGTSVVHYRPAADGSLDAVIVVESDTDHPVTDIHQASNGDVFVGEVTSGPNGQDITSFARYGFDGGRDELDVAAIYDVAVVDGVESVIVAVAAPDDLALVGDAFGGVQAWAVDDLRLVADLGLSAEAEFTVTDFHWNRAAELGVATAWSDLTEWVGFVDADGSAVELPSPTDDLDYNAPPYVTAATISPDGSTLYWAEGPDWGYDPETNESGPIAASWVLHGADLLTGESTLTLTLGEPVPDRSTLDVPSIVAFDDYIVVNRTTGFGADLVALAPLVVDFTGDEPVLYEYPVVGIATASAIG